MLSRITAAEALSHLDAFDTLIDARSPAEYALDRLPGAVNWPTLNDDERRICFADCFAKRRICFGSAPATYQG